MTRYTAYVPALIVALLLTAAVPPAAAQTDIANLQDVIQRNEEMLHQARELVRETSSIRARASLETATKLHVASKNFLSSQRLQLAAESARKAREAIAQTILLAKKDAKLEEAAARQIDRAAERLDRAMQLLSDNRDMQSASTMKRVDEAKMQLQRANDNMREHHYEVAFRLARSSEELSQRAISTVRNDFTDPEAVISELQRTDELLERIAEQMHDRGDAVRRLFDEAVAFQQRAQDNYHRGQFQLALELTQTARRLAMRAGRATEPGVNDDRVLQAIHLTDMLIEEAREIAVDRNVANLDRRIEQAVALQTRAKDQFQRGHDENALDLTMRARGILRDALADLKQDLDPERVRTTLVQTDEVLARLRAALGESDSESAKEIAARAVSQQQQAWQEYDGGRPRAALAHTKLARRLARRAFGEMNGDEP